MSRVETMFVTLKYTPYVWSSGPLVLQHDTLDEARDYAIEHSNNHPGYADHVSVWYGEVQHQV